LFSFYWFRVNCSAWMLCSLRLGLYCQLVTKKESCLYGMLPRINRLMSTGRNAFPSEGTVSVDEVS